MNIVKMENKDKMYIGIIGLISLLLGGSVFLTEDEFNQAFYCTATEEIGIFYGGISGTGLTAYPYIENRTDFERCKKDGISGTWIPLIEYLEDQEIDILSLLKSQNQTQNGTSVNIKYNYKNFQCNFLNNYENGTMISSQECREI